MGWQVMGFGHIDVEEKHMEEVIDLMIGDKRKIINKLFGNDDIDDFEEVEGKDGYISFKMFGNKMINYNRLDRIKEYCKSKKINVSISVGEYTESNEGYYYNSEDDEEDNEVDLDANRNRD